MATTKPMAKPTTSPAWANEWARLIFQLYLAGVCGFSLIFGTFSTARFFTHALDVMLPPPIFVIETEWNDVTKTEQPRPIEDIERERNQQLIAQTFNIKRDLMHSGIYLLLAFGVFGYHWRLFKARKE